METIFLVAEKCAYRTFSYRQEKPTKIIGHAASPEWTAGTEAGSEALSSRGARRRRATARRRRRATAAKGDGAAAAKGDGRSDLAIALMRIVSAPQAGLTGTARNWATMTRLLAMCG